MSTILIGGYYGAGNVGDEAILHTILQDLRKYNLALNFIVLSHNPKKTSEEYAVESIYWEDINALLDAALRCDLIVLGGGGIFHDYWGIDVDKYLRKGFWDMTAFGSLPLLAELLNIPCAILAVGVGPLRTELGREQTRRAFERCQIATVRDNESMEYLRQTGIKLNDPDSPIVHVIPDIVFGFETHSSDMYDMEEFLEEQYSLGKETPLLGISLRYWESEIPLKERLTSVAQGITKFLRNNPEAHVITIPFQVLNATPHTDDSIVLRELAEIIDMPERVHLINTPITPQLTQALIGRCKTVLGMRFHSIVMSINSGTPVVAISYAPKVQSIMKSTGLSEYCNLSLTPDPNKLEKQLQTLWSTGFELRPSMIASHNHLKIRAQEHAKTVINFLNRIKKRPPLNTQQEFILKQARLLYNADAKIDAIHQELQIKSQLLTEIETSRFWKLAKTYYRLTQALPFMHARKLYHTWKNDGLFKVFKILRSAATSWFKRTINYSAAAFSQASNNIIKTEIDLETMLVKINQRSLNGIFIMAGNAIFDETHAQRVINFSKFLSQHGWSVIVVCSTLDVDKEILFRTAAKNSRYDNKVFYYISMDMFLRKMDVFYQLSNLKRYFVIESPHPNLFLPALTLRSHGFDIIYEITNQWEQSFLDGEITWFDKKMEDAFVINANIVTAVSQPLLEKFSRLREDIHLIPNGYNSKPLYKKKHRGLQDSDKKPDHEIQLHHSENTSASLDWEQQFSELLKILEASKWKSL